MPAKDPHDDPRWDRWCAMGMSKDEMRAIIKQDADVDQILKQLKEEQNG